MRTTITYEEIQAIRKELSEANKAGIRLEAIDKFYTRMINEYGHSAPSRKKIMATEKATKIRSEKTKQKIQNAINLMRLEGEKITQYSLAKKANVSYNTVGRYINDFEKINN